MLRSVLVAMIGASLVSAQGAPAPAPAPAPAAAPAEAPPVPVQTQAEIEQAKKALTDAEAKEEKDRINDSLCMAAWYGNMENMEKAKAAGADINARWKFHEYGGYTPLLALFNQMRSNWKEAAEWLLKAGANADDVVNDRSILSYAVVWNNTEAFDWARAKMKKPYVGKFCYEDVNACSSHKHNANFCKTIYADGACNEAHIDEMWADPTEKAWLKSVGITNKHDRTEL